MLFEEYSSVICMLHKTTYPLVLLLQQLFFNMQTLVGRREGGGGGGGIPPQIISLIGSSEQLISISAKINSYKFIFN